jgi:hypothetical protein
MRNTSFKALRRLDSLDKVQLSSMSPHRFSKHSASPNPYPDRTKCTTWPGKVRLACRSSSGRDYESIAVGTLNLLEALRFLARPIRSTTRGRWNVLVIHTRSSMSTLLYGQSVPMVWLRQLHFGKLPTIGKHMDCSPVGMLSNHESPLRPNAL